jgi:hypothetical protein
MTANNITIGLDLGDRRHAACVLSASGEILAEEAITNTRECLTAFASRYAAGPVEEWRRVPRAPAGRLMTMPIFSPGSVFGRLRSSVGIIPQCDNQ